MKPEELITQIKELDSNHLLEWDDLDDYVETDDYYQISVSTKDEQDFKDGDDEVEFVNPQMEELSKKLWNETKANDMESLWDQKVHFNFWINK